MKINKTSMVLTLKIIIFKPDLISRKNGNRKK